jgi:hypothetical protein
MQNNYDQSRPGDLIKWFFVNPPDCSESFHEVVEGVVEVLHERDVGDNRLCLRVEALVRLSKFFK